MSDSANDFNSAKWVADFASQFLQKNLEKIYGGGKRLLKGASENINLLLASYEEYLNCVVDRYSKTRSFLIRDESIDLHKFYIPLGVSCSNKHIPQASIRTLITKNRFVVITGNGGSGKSMMMRYLFLDAVKSKEKVPIFVELRDINDLDKSILELVKQALSVNKFGFGDEYIEKALKAGLFAILLDGYDEVVNAKRKQVADEIEQLTQDYDKNYIIVSSRPDLEFGGWHPFAVWQISPLTLEQACELVAKVPGDEELKAKFTEDLQEKLFEEHKSFLSNPLLLSIMLLTYKDNAEIPKKLSIFYQQAYEALFNRHDALKGTWQREHATSLDIQDFAQIFSAFSLLTYDKRITNFSPTDAIDFLKKAKQLRNIDFKPDDYLKDAKRAVCLLIDDGRDLSFTHRSFQEYFVALFIANSTESTQERLLARYYPNLDADNVINLLYDLKPELIEQKIIIPEIERIEKIIQLRKQLGIKNYCRYLNETVKELVFFDDQYQGYVPRDFNFSALRTFIFNRLGALVGLRFPFEDDDSDYDSIDLFISALKRKKVNNKPIYESLETDLPIREITKDLELTKLFGQANHTLSFSTLRAFLKIKEMLIKKYLKANASLDKMLSE